jgi:hypothetical protein
MICKQVSIESPISGPSIAMYPKRSEQSLVKTLDSEGGRSGSYMLEPISHRVLTVSAPHSNSKSNLPPDVAHWLTSACSEAAESLTLTKDGVVAPPSPSKECGNYPRLVSKRNESPFLHASLLFPSMDSLKRNFDTFECVSRNMSSLKKIKEGPHSERSNCASNGPEAVATAAGD